MNLTAPPADAEVKVSFTDGKIHLHVPALFTPHDDATIHTLMERLFQASAVQAVAVDREQRAIDIHYDHSAFDVKAALRLLSDRLLSSEKPHGESLVLQYLSRVPGQVKRVERRRHEETTPRNNAHVHPTESLLVVENLIVEYDPAPTTKTAASEETLNRQAPAAGGSLPSDVTKPWAGEVVVGGVRRIVYLTAAGGCLVMSIVGVITPGIPTVPFVLATGYFLARSSPSLHARFRRAPLFGQMLTDYEDHGGLRWTTKLKAILLTFGLMAITVILAGPSLPLLLVVTVMGSLGIYLVARIPTIKTTSTSPALAPA